MNITTHHVYPPIPTRDHDWSAFDSDTYDGAPDAGPLSRIVGYGATERDAINNLVEQLVDAEADAALGTVPDGWKLVPIEPMADMGPRVLEEMGASPWAEERGIALEYIEDAYRNMVAAAPSRPGVGALSHLSFAVIAEELRKRGATVTSAPHADLRLPPFEAFERGGIVGEAEIVDCIERSDSPWFFGNFGFVLRNPTSRPFIPYRGELGIFTVPDELLSQGTAE